MSDGYLPVRESDNRAGSHGAGAGSYGGGAGSYAASAGAGVGAGTATAFIPPLTTAGEDLPPTEEIRTAYEKVSYADRLRKSIMSTTNRLIVVAEIAVLVAMLFLPVLRIYGQSMNATLSSGELVVSLKGANFKTGDIVAFYYNNNILVKRVIANSGDWVDIDLDGNVYVNQQQIDEPYIKESTFSGFYGNMTPPEVIPEGKVFVLGDNRRISLDSRTTEVGLIDVKDVIGKAQFVAFPFDHFGYLY